MTKYNNLPTLNLPQYAFNIKNEKGKLFIFDGLRKRFITLTPEEWVRQNFVQYLIDGLGYAPGKLGNEIEIKLNGMSRRCDSIVFNNFGKPVMIVEFKAPEIPIDQKVFDQIFSYNIKLQVPYLVISNGLKHFACKVEDNKAVFLQQIPGYDVIKG